ncbi:hypothetical protein [Persephonella sp.]
MAKYAVFDKQGFPKAFYTPDVHTNIPKKAIKITDEQWFEFINNQGKRKWDFDKNDVVVYEPPPPPLNELKTQRQKELLQIEKTRVQKILDNYGYISLADVQFYASQNDTEAQALLSWYQTYDSLIWSYIDNDLSAFTDIQELLAVDMKNIEQQIYQQSIEQSPLPQEA